MKDLQSPRLNRFRTAPNLLTLLRICLAPFLVSAILEDRYALSLVLFLAAGLTDALDGLLARALKQRTVLGAYLDPVADKLLLSTLVPGADAQGADFSASDCSRLWQGCGNPLVAAILYAAVGRREFNPSVFGKANTLAQVTAVAVVLLHRMFGAPWVVELARWALWATMALTVASGLHYSWVAARRVAAAPANGHGAK